MSQDGYTLAEALAALLIVGLAVGGLTQSLSTLGRLEGAAALALKEQRARRIGQQELARLLEHRGPFRSTEPTFKGVAGSFEFHCGEGRMCGARLESARGTARLALQEGSDVRTVTLPGASNPHFTYQTDAGVLQAWPPEGPRQALRSVSLVGGAVGAETPLAVAKVWTDQSANCAFDAIAQDCRENAP